jgi:SHS2 domain-containing protein
MGARTASGKDEEQIAGEVSDEDLGGALVGLLDEVIYLVDRYEARVADVKVQFDGDLVIATVVWGASSDPLEGTELKAATYHQLEVRRDNGSWVATVYFDV